MEHPLHFWNSFNPIPAGNYFIGSDENDIQTAFDFWRTRLLDQFDPELFKTWLLKEFPRLAYTTELFYMSTYPITQGVYNWFLQDANYSHQPLSNLTLEESKLDHPVWGVTYEDTQIFCDWLSMQLQKKFVYRMNSNGRLQPEAQTIWSIRMVIVSMQRKPTLLNPR